MLFFKPKTTSMEKEIYQQSEIVQNVLDAYILNQDIAIDVADNINRIIIVASGSSYHCARYAADLFGSIANIEASAMYSSEFLLKTKIAVNDEILYVFITQSGETSDTNLALTKAKDSGLKTLCITNIENSSIWNKSDYKIACHAGEEESIAATKSLTSQLLCSTLLVLKFAQKKGQNVAHLIRDLNNIADIIDEIYKNRPKIKQIARFLSKFKNIVMCADGISYALAKECSLKVKETSYKITSSYILGEFMHGHVAVLNNKSSALVYIANEDLTPTAIKNLNKIKENYNPAIVIIGNRTNQVKSTFNIDTKCEKPLLKTFANLVIIQILALEIALKLHHNVDKPHGLNKVVK